MKIRGMYVSNARHKTAKFREPGSVIFEDHRMKQVYALKLHLAENIVDDMGPFRVMKLLDYSQTEYFSVHPSARSRCPGVYTFRRKRRLPV